MLGINEILDRVQADLALREVPIAPDMRFGSWEQFRHAIVPPYVIFGMGPFVFGPPNPQLAPGPVRRESATRVCRVLLGRLQTARVWVCGARPAESTDPADWEQAQEESTAALLHEVAVSIDRVCVRVGGLTWGQGDWLHPEVEGLYGSVAWFLFTLQLPVFDVTLDRLTPSAAGGTVTTNNSAGSAVEVIAPKP